MKKMEKKAKKKNVIISESFVQQTNASDARDTQPRDAVTKTGANGICNCVDVCPGLRHAVLLSRVLDLQLDGADTADAGTLNVCARTFSFK